MRRLETRRRETTEAERPASRSDTGTTQDHWDGDITIPQAVVLGPAATGETNRHPRYAPGPTTSSDHSVGDKLHEVQPGRSSARSGAAYSRRSARGLPSDGRSASTVHDGPVEPTLDSCRQVVAWPQAASTVEQLREVEPIVSHLTTPVSAASPVPGNWPGESSTNTVLLLASRRGRIGHRQGTHRPADSRAQSPAQRSVRGRQLRSSWRGDR